MCGIAGFLNIKADIDVKYETIRKMTDIIRHRGPDDEGFYVDNDIGLGMRRLSIIDLNGGHQPIFNEDKSLVLVFNGEIYNFKELKSELISKGHIIKTNSDTEVIIHAYEEYGEECVSKLNGMFAFALWDIKNKELFIARDRLGVKPLYYYSDNNIFIFGSEIKSILSTGYIKKQIDFNSFNLYLSFYYIPAPYTIYKGIKKLQPGNFIKINNQGMSIKRYWDITINPDISILNYQDHKDNIYNLLNDSVKRRMIADVPLGAFLSGGIDSSIITGLMSRSSLSPVNTFNIAFRDYKVYDESDRARSVAAFNKSQHHEFVLDHKDISEIVSKIIWDLEEPFADSSVIPTFYVSRETKKHVTVALSGDGGDELFGGYSKYTWEYWQRIYERIPEYLRKAVIERLLEKLPSGRGNSFKELVRKAKKFINSMNSVPETRHFNLMLNFNDDLRKELFSNEEYFIENISSQLIYNFYNQYENQDNLFKMEFTDLKVALPDDMLTKVDKMSMLNSLEVRSPFLDYRLAEYAFSIPSKYKIKNGKTKYILKDTFSDLLPKDILNKSKSGFGVPIGEWFKKELKPLLLDVLSKRNVESVGLIKYNTIEKIIKDHIDEKSDYSNQLWSLFVFHVWNQIYMEKN